MAGEKILIVEDEENLLVALEYSLSKEGYKVATASDGVMGLEIARSDFPDLIILDIMLPGLDGLEISRILRSEVQTPIILLTAKSEEIDRVVGLELGADDYVTKPFSMRELIARVKVILRRYQPIDVPSLTRQSPILETGDLRIDLNGHTVTLAGNVLDLKPREFDLIELFVGNKGRAFSRGEILTQLWGHDFIGDPRTVDVHVRWLRKKIEREPDNPQRIVTVRGMGYKFTE